MKQYNGIVDYIRELPQNITAKEWIKIQNVSDNLKIGKEKLVMTKAMLEEKKKDIVKVRSKNKEFRRVIMLKEVDNTALTKKQNEWFSKNAHTNYMKEIEDWWKSLNENDKMDVYDNMVDFLK